MFLAARRLLSSSTSAAAARVLAPRSVGIIAHVDHGKTTLVDCLLRQSGTLREGEGGERAMDRNDLERERGITILSKCTAVNWRGHRLNIVDTPGHADFGGEVERVMGMVDGVLVLVDAAEGPQAQTKFVLGKALRLGLRPLVVVNKADKMEARPYEVQDEMFDLFQALEASDEQLDFPTLFASAKGGWAAHLPEPEHRGEGDGSMEPLFQAILDHVPARDITDALQRPFRMIVTSIDRDPFVGRLVSGRIEEGTVTVNSPVASKTLDGTLVDQGGRVSKILQYHGLQQLPVDSARAGDIVLLAGLDNTTVSHTVVATPDLPPLPGNPIDPATLSMEFSVNDSPLGGKSGSKLTSALIRDRLYAEAEHNVSIQVGSTDRSDVVEVKGRGELQLSVLIETMRREGFELAVSRPRIIYREGEGGEKLEPVEEVAIDVDDAYVGTVIEQMGLRRGEMQDQRPVGGKQRLTFLVPSRGLIGFQSQFMTETRGTGVMSRLFHAWQPHKGALLGAGAQARGVIISTDLGKAITYALNKVQDRGRMFIRPGDPVYRGMIIGQSNTSQDVAVNPVKTKELTNIRAAGKDEAAVLTPPIEMGLEKALSFLGDDDLLEVTPDALRLRKKVLDGKVLSVKDKAKRASGN